MLGFELSVNQQSLQKEVLVVLMVPEVADDGEIELELF